MSVQPLVAVESPLRLVQEDEVKVRPLHVVRLEPALRPARAVRPVSALKREPALKTRTGFDVAFNIAAVLVIAMALLVLGIVLAIVSSPEAGSVASGFVGSSSPVAGGFGGSVV